MFQDLGWQLVSLVVPFSLMNLTDLNMNTVELVLYMQLIRHLVNIREAASNPVTNALETPGHLGGVHRGVHADDFTTEEDSVCFQLTTSCVSHKIM